MSLILRAPKINKTVTLWCKREDFVRAFSVLNDIVFGIVAVCAKAQLVSQFSSTLFEMVETVLKQPN